MVIRNSGVLAFSEIQVEFGGSNPIGMGEYYSNAATEYALGTSLVTQGSVIGMGSFYGKQKSKLYPPQPLINGTVIGQNTVSISGYAYGNGTYVAAASSAFSSNNPMRAFDAFGWSSFVGYDSNTGIYNGGTANVGGYVGEFIKLTLPNPITLVAYQFSIAATNMPKDWKVLGSNNGSVWMYIDEQKSYSSNISTTYTKQVEPTNAFSMYAIVIKKVAVGQTYISLSNVKFHDNWTKVRASAGNNQVAVSWIAPTSTPVLYRIRAKSVERTVYLLVENAYTTTSAIVSGLVNGETYSISIEAKYDATWQGIAQGPQVFLSNDIFSTRVFSRGIVETSVVWSWDTAKNSPFTVSNLNLGHTSLEYRNFGSGWLLTGMNKIVSFVCFTGLPAIPLKRLRIVSNFLGTLIDAYNVNLADYNNIAFSTGSIDLLDELFFFCYRDSASEVSVSMSGTELGMYNYAANIVVYSG